MVTGLKSRIFGYMSIGDNVWIRKKENICQQQQKLLFNQAKDLLPVTQYDI